MGAKDLTYKGPGKNNGDDETDGRDESVASRPSRFGPRTGKDKGLLSRIPKPKGSRLDGSLDSPKDPRRRDHCPTTWDSSTQDRRHRMRYRRRLELCVRVAGTKGGSKGGPTVNGRVKRGTHTHIPRPVLTREL